MERDYYRDYSRDRYRTERRSVRDYYRDQSRGYENYERNSNAEWKGYYYQERDRMEKDNYYETRSNINREENNRHEQSHNQNKLVFQPELTLWEREQEHVQPRQGDLCKKGGNQSHVSENRGAGYCYRDAGKNTEEIPHRREADERLDLKRKLIVDSPNDTKLKVQRNLQNVIDQSQLDTQLGMKHRTVGSDSTESKVKDDIYRFDCLKDAAMIIYKCVMLENQLDHPLWENKDIDVIEHMKTEKKFNKKCKREDISKIEHKSCMKEDISEVELKKTEEKASKSCAYSKIDGQSYGIENQNVMCFCKNANDRLILEKEIFDEIPGKSELKVENDPQIESNKKNLINNEIEEINMKSIETIKERDHTDICEQPHEGIDHINNANTQNYMSETDKLKHDQQSNLQLQTYITRQRKNEVQVSKISVASNEQCIDLTKKHKQIMSVDKESDVIRTYDPETREINNEKIKTKVYECSKKEKEVNKNVVNYDVEQLKPARYMTANQVPFDRKNDIEVVIQQTEFKKGISLGNTVTNVQNGKVTEVEMTTTKDTNYEISSISQKRGKAEKVQNILKDFMSIQLTVRNTKRGIG